MTRITKIVLIIVLVYFATGLVYHYRSSSCYKIRHATDFDADDHYKGPQGIIGLLSNVAFWPISLYVDSSDQEGIFNCVPEEKQAGLNVEHYAR